MNRPLSQSALRSLKPIAPGVVIGPVLLWVPSLIGAIGAGDHLTPMRILDAIFFAHATALPIALIGWACFLLPCFLFVPRESIFWARGRAVISHLGVSLILWLIVFGPHFPLDFSSESLGLLLVCVAWFTTGAVIGFFSHHEMGRTQQGVAPYRRSRGSG